MSILEPSGGAARCGARRTPARTAPGRRDRPSGVSPSRQAGPPDRLRPLTMASSGPAADAARAEFRELMEAKGHAVENARAAVAGLEAAFADGAPRAGRRSSTRCSPT